MSSQPTKATDSPKVGMIDAGGKLIPLPPRELGLTDAQRLANVLAASGYFKLSPDEDGRRAVAQATVKIMVGYELGISPIQSVMCIHYIKEKLAYEAILLGATLKRRGYDYKPLVQTDEEVKLEFFNPAGVSIGVVTWTIAEARRAKLTEKDNWRNYPGDLLWARCVARGCRRFCAEVFGGPVYVPEELGADVDDQGAPIDDAVPFLPAPNVPTPTQELNALLRGLTAPADTMTLGGVHPPVEEVVGVSAAGAVVTAKVPQLLTDEEAEELDKLDFGDADE